MRPALALALFGWSMLCSGCALIQDGQRNLCNAICAPFETHRENTRNRRWAEDAWQQFSCSGKAKRNDDFAQGFKDGYIEYLYRGGDGEPPLVAPAKYRHFRYQSPTGFLAIEDWFAGYRHGAAMARDTGMRNFITGPSSLSHDAPAEVKHEMPPVVRESGPVNPAPTVGLPPPQFSVEVVETPKTVPPALQFEMPKPGSLTDSLQPPARLKITNVSEAQEPTRVKITNVVESPEPEPIRARITGVSTPDPVRARITTITPAPKD